MCCFTVSISDSFMDCSFSSPVINFHETMPSLPPLCLSLLLPLNASLPFLPALKMLVTFIALLITLISLTNYLHKFNCEPFLEYLDSHAFHLSPHKITGLLSPQSHVSAAFYSHLPVVCGPFPSSSSLCSLGMLFLLSLWDAVIQLQQAMCERDSLQTNDSPCVYLSCCHV